MLGNIDTEDVVGFPSSKQMYAFFDMTWDIDFKFFFIERTYRH